MRRTLLIATLSLLCLATAYADGRFTQLLDGRGWRMMRDKQATWRNDKLFLPNEVEDLSMLPVNPPTGGWQSLNEQSGIAVSVPGSVEEYLTQSAQPQPQDNEGVSWWWRKLTVPKEMKGRRVLLNFESVRMRAEVYLDGQLVAYDIIGETPFAADVTHAIRFGEEQTLAVRVTNPGGNFHWQDYVPQYWGDYQIPPGRGFGGIIGSVGLDCVTDISLADVFIQNTPEPRTVNVALELVNETGKNAKRDVTVTIVERDAPEHVVYEQTYKGIALASGLNKKTMTLECPQARLWDIGQPNLYICKVELKKGKRVEDNDQRSFGFRWFAPDGVGRDAVLRLNGRRVMLRSAIGWGYFPVTGLAATDEMAERQVKAAQQLGLNMLNFHRCIGRPNVLQKADSLGLLYYEEPGGWQTAGKNAFCRAFVNEKVRRMMRRDRSHPSLVIYNLINEYGGASAADPTLVDIRMADMKEAHTGDSTRMLTFTSGWATSEKEEQDSKANMRPYDNTLYRRGWFDNHRAGGPATYREDYYQGPTKNYMYTDNRTEVYMRGEEGAISTPPRLELIHNEMQRTGKTGWDGLFWEKQYQAFKNYFEKKGLAASFGTIDSLCCQMGDVQLEHQGRRIQSMRMQNLGDCYVVNGWESMPYDNHSGIVDNYRNSKGFPETMSRYCRPLYLAVCTRNQVVRAPGKATIDCYIVNEEDVKGSHTLRLYLKRPDGKRQELLQREVTVSGGETYGELLLEGTEVDIKGEAGMYTIEGELLSNGKTITTGNDQVLAVDWDKDELAGRGAIYGSDNDEVARFYQASTGKTLPSFANNTKKLDWLVVNRSSLDEPELIPADAFQNLTLSWFSDNDIRVKVGEEKASDVNKQFIAGAQPCQLLPANQTFSATWEGDLVSKETGLHLLGIEATAGVRIYINGQQILDKYWNKTACKETRPLMMEAGKPIHIKVGYYQHGDAGSVQLKWSLPGSVRINPQSILDRAKNDGTTVVILGKTETWIKEVAKATGIQYTDYYNVGENWVGGIHFVKRHPLFNGLPQGVAMNWPYQALVRDGSNRYGFHLEGEEMVVGSYRSWPFHLGTAVGIVPYGKGRIIFSTLDVVDNLNQSSGPAEVARKLFCNMINYPLQTSANDLP